MNKEQLGKLSDRALSEEIKNTFKYWEPSFDINNPSDMMPLVFVAGISLVRVIDGYNANNGDLNGNGTIVDIDFAYEHLNPLRAAAIVYLLIKGVADE
jgi:hypothetical protein